MSITYFLRSIYSTNKKMFLLFVLLFVVLAIVSCNTGSGGTPPSGPIGGGCG